MGRILRAFEAAEERPEEHEKWLTFVVVGAGPTGVEMAGQIAELARQTLKGEFRRVDPAKARVLLVEMGDRVLAGFPDTAVVVWSIGDWDGAIGYAWPYLA